MNKDLATLHLLFEYGVDVELLESNPVRKKHRLNEEEFEPVILTLDQYEALLTQCEDDPMLWLYVLTLGETAMRSTSEASWLRFEDVDLKTQFIRVGEARTTKTKRKRQVIMTDRLLGAMDEHLQRYRLMTYDGERSPWLFHHLVTARHHQAGDRVTSFYDGFKRRAERAKLPPELRQHDLRHSKITWLLTEGKPIQTVQGLAGHSTVKMTERYYRYLHEHQRILVEREDAKTVSATL